MSDEDPTDDIPPTDEHDTVRESRVTTDPATVEEWAMAHDEVPVREPPESGHAAAVRLVPRDVATGNQRIEWSEFHEEAERLDLALVRRGEDGRDLRVVRRHEAAERAVLDTDEVEDALARGETVTTEMAELSVEEPEAAGAEEADVQRDPAGRNPGGSDLAESDPAESDEVVDSERAAVTRGEVGAGEVGSAGSDVRGEGKMGESQPLPSRDDQGKPVVDLEGERIGVVADVEGDTMYVDPHVSIVDRVKAVFDWGERDREAYPVPPELVELVGGEVVLRVHRNEELEEKL